MTRLHALAFAAMLSLASGASTAAAQQAKPIDHMTAFMVYHKLSGEPIDYDEIVRQLLRVQSRPPQQRAQLHAQRVAELQRAYEAADPEATYVLATQTRLRYAHGSGRIEVPLFTGDVVIQMNPFEQQDDWMMANVNHRARYRRSLQFVNHEPARFVSIADERMQPIVLQQVQPHSDYQVVAEVRFRFVDAVPHHEEWRKSLRVMVESVRYRYRGAGPIAQHWPLTEPVPVATVEVARADEGPRNFDDVVGFYLYHKAAGTTPDFDALAQLTNAVTVAPQFEKASIAAREAERMRRDFDAVDPGAIWVTNLQSRLDYDMDTERFTVIALAPNMAMNVQPLGGLGAARHHTSGASARTWRHLMVFDNADRYHFIPLPRDQAAAMPDVYERGQVMSVVSIKMRVAGVGEPTRNAPGGTLRMAIESVRLSPTGRFMSSDVNWPFNEPVVR